MTKHTDEQHPVSGVNITRSTLNLRIKPEDKILIDRAAHAAGKNRTEFVLEAARRAAEETLADLRVIDVSWHTQLLYAASENVKSILHCFHEALIYFRRISIAHFDILF